MKKPQPKKTTAATSISNVAINDSGLKRIMMIVCALFAFALYSNTLNHDFTVDDNTVMKGNKIVTKGPSAIPEIFATAYRKGFWERQESLYRPLSLVMFSIEWKLSGGKPWLGHWVNVILYSLTAVILFSLLLLMFQNKNIAVPFLITLLYIAHPLHTEVIANIKSRDEILCFLFGMLSLYFLLKWIRDQKTSQMIIAAVSILLAMLSKENALTFVVITPLTLFFFSKASKQQLIKGSLIVVGAAAVYMAIRLSVLKGVTNFTEIQLVNNSLVGADDDFGKRLASAIYINGKYLALLVFPHPLSFDYSYNSLPLVTFADVRSLIPLLVIIVLAVYAIKNFSKKDAVSYAIIFYALTISLVSNIAFLIESTMAERFAYIPSLGFCIALPVFLSNYLKTDSKKNSYSTVTDMFRANKKLASAIVVIVMLFSVKTFSRNFDWKTNETLLSQDVQSYPESARIRYAYGSLLVIEKGLDEKDPALKAKYLDQGIEQLKKGVSILSSYSDAWYHLGIAYKEKSDLKNALEAFEVVRKQKPKKEIDFYIAIGITEGELKMYDQAFADFKEGIALKPESDEAYNNLGMYYTEAGRYYDAIAALSKSIELNKKNEQALYNLGNTYSKFGDFKTAISYYDKAIEVKPDYTDAWNNKGNSYGSIKDFPNALKAYQKLIEIDPTNSKVMHNIGVTYYMLGDTVKAQEYVNRAAQMNK